MPYIEVTSRPESFRRAGLSFTREPRRLEVDNKTLKVLAGEANLKVLSLPGKEIPQSKKTTAPGKGKGNN